MEKTEFLDESCDLSEDELASKLSDAVSKAEDNNEKALSFLLFGIKYGKTIIERNYRVNDILAKANISDSCNSEINKGIKLSNFVSFNENDENKKRYCVVPANPTRYDHAKCFNSNGCVDWVHKNYFSNTKVGDIVFVYVTQPDSQIKYKCVIDKKDIDSKNTIDSDEYHKVPNENEGERYVRLKLIKEIDDDRLKKSNLEEKGFPHSLQQLMWLENDKKALGNYIDSIFEEEQPLDKNGSENKTFAFDVSNKDGTNLIVYGTPGCGKSYYIEHTLLKDYRHDDNNLCIDSIRTTFYQDYTNTDFVGQIMPVVKNDGSVTYEFNPGPFTLALNKAIQNPDRPIALVIEELNRGNAPSIFGDIFQLLDRRDGTSVYNITNVNIQKYLEDENPNYKFDYIKLPSNLSIFATMNTSDQNVFTLDTAFKRRWKFEKLKNSFNDDHPYSSKLIPGMDIDWKRFCESINNLILESKDEITNSEDKQIGVYFVEENMLRMENVKSIELQRKEFAYKLFEYLWDDVFKYSRDTLFKGAKSLDDLIDRYVKQGEDDTNGICVFAENVFKKDS